MPTHPDIQIRADWDKLTDKERAMIQHYLRTGNKRKSYRLAYYPDGDHAERCTAKTLTSNSYHAFNKPKIKVVIEQIQQAAVQSAQLTLDQVVQANVDDLIERQNEVAALKVDAVWVLRRAAMLADFNINRFIRVVDGRAVYDFSEADEADWYCVSEYVTDMSVLKGGDGEPVPVERVKLKTVDKLRALELVGKHVDVGAFKDQVELSGSKENPVRTVTRRIVRTETPTDDS